MRAFEAVFIVAFNALGFRQIQIIYWMMTSVDDDSKAGEIREKQGENHQRTLPWHESGRIDR